MDGKTDMQVAEVLQRIRARVAARKKSVDGTVNAPVVQPSPELAPRTSTLLPLYNLSELHQNLSACNLLYNRGGMVGARLPGLKTALTQPIKKAMSRLLRWYTVPVHEYHAAVTRALNETTRAIENIYESVLAATDQLDERIESLDKRIESWNEDVNKRLSAFDDALATTRDTQRNSDLAKGLATAAGLFFNEPVVIRYDKERALWSATHERIIERAWIYRQLSSVPVGSRILDLGCCESPVALELASNGYQVTGVDIRDYALRHPNLEFVKADICSTNLELNRYDVAISLSTIEHIGLGAYGDPLGESLPQAAIREIFRVLKRGGLFLVTLPFGHGAVTPLHKVYDSGSLRGLLKDFQIDKLEFGVRLDEKTWIAPTSEEQAGAQKHDSQSYLPGAVALVACTKSDKPS
jgi:SAM-dependent methyltransferase